MECLMAEPQAGAPRRQLGTVKRVVVKVGSGVIAQHGLLRPKVVAILAHDLAVLMRQGYEVVAVVSGAVAAGFRALGFETSPKEVVERQAAASVGQHRLMAVLAREFRKHRLSVAQLLLSADDIENRRRFLSARHTLQTLLARRVVPIINENDAVSDDEIKVGDNDHLAALITSLVTADLLIILSSVPGIYRNGDSRCGEIISRVEVDDSLEAHIGTFKSTTGVGGMGAKVSAARLASRWGVPTIIGDGTKAGTLSEIVAGKPLGTMFVPHDRKLSSRKQWIAVRTRSRGALWVDTGAQQALHTKGASLLPTGVVKVEEDFPIGSRVDIKDAQGQIFAVGLASYSAADIRKLQGRKISEIEQVLGYKYIPEIVHRDDLVVL